MGTSSDMGVALSVYVKYAPLYGWKVEDSDVCAEECKKEVTVQVSDPGYTLVYPEQEEEVLLRLAEEDVMRRAKQRFEELEKERLRILSLPRNELAR